MKRTTTTIAGSAIHEIRTLPGGFQAVKAGQATSDKP
jgi:hypothetical protein